MLRKYLLGIIIICSPVLAFAADASLDSFYNVPNLGNGCDISVRIAQAIGNKTSGEVFCTRSGGGLRYWDMIGSENASGTYQIAIVGTTVSSTVWVAHRYLYIMSGLLSGGSPVCYDRVTDVNGVVLGRSYFNGTLGGVPSAYGSGLGWSYTDGATDITPYFCVYDLQNDTTLSDGLLFQDIATSTMNWMNGSNTSAFTKNVPRIYQVFSSASSTLWQNANQYGSLASTTLTFSGMLLGTSTVVTVSPGESVTSSCFDSSIFTGGLTGVTFTQFGTALVCSIQNIVLWSVSKLFIPTQEAEEESGSIDNKLSKKERIVTINCTNK